MAGIVMCCNTNYFSASSESHHPVWSPES